MKFNCSCYRKLRVFMTDRRGDIIAVMTISSCWGFEVSMVDAPVGLKLRGTQQVNHSLKIAQQISKAQQDSTFHFEKIGFCH